MKRYYLTITPQIYGPQGDLFNLAPVRYEVAEEMMGDIYDNDFTQQSPRFSGYKGAGSAVILRIQFSSADIPHPHTLPVIE